MVSCVSLSYIKSALVIHHSLYCGKVPFRIVTKIFGHYIVLWIHVIDTICTFSSYHKKRTQAVLTAPMPLDLLRITQEILRYSCHVVYVRITSFLIRISENLDEELTAGDIFFKEEFNDSSFVKIRQKVGAFQG